MYNITIVILIFFIGNYLQGKRVECRVKSVFGKIII